MNIGKLCIGCLRTNAYTPVSSVCKKWSLIGTFLNRNSSSIKHPDMSDEFQSENGIPLKNRRKIKCPPTSSEIKPGCWTVAAYATAENYNLRNLRNGLKEQGLYIPSELTSNEILKSGVGSALHTVAKYQVSPENRHMYYFEEGTVIMWNVNKFEQNTVLKFLKTFENSRYEPRFILAEIETMAYEYNRQSKKSYIHDGTMYIGTMEKSPEDIESDRYTLSNAMSLSVKLGVLEELLEEYIRDIEFLTDDLKFGHPVRFSQQDVLRKSGQIFALRHSVNLSTDFLDTPDFYWEHEELEALYKRACNYFGIARRTKVLNEKLNNCVELLQLVSTHLSDEHHVRLEWMIIILIMVEIVFEVLHFFKN